MPDIFISYSRKDSAQAIELAERLRESGVKVWIDQQGIVGAEHWAREIAEGIRACSTFLLLLSPESVSSEEVLKELALASERRKRILPVELAPTELPSSFEYQLAGLQRVSIADFDKILRSHQHGVERVATKDTRKSLMILPFEDLSPTQDNGWFADGLVSEFVSALGNIKSLRLMDWNTSKEFKNRKVPTATLAKELDIRYFLEGQVRKVEDKIKVSVSLLDFETADYLWQYSYRGAFADIFDIQEEIAAKTVHGLKLHLTNEEERKLNDRGTENAEAYELFLKGEQYYELRTKEGFEYAIQLFREAMRLDPHFAEAHLQAAAGLAELYRNYDRSPHLLEEAEQIVDHVRQFKPSAQSELEVLGLIRLLQGRLDEAESLMKKMVELEPGNSSSHFGLGFFYAQTDQIARSIALFEESLRLTPEDTVVHMNLVMAYDLAGDKQGRIRAAERALPILEKRIRLVPDDESARVLHADLLQRAGRNEEAATALAKLNGIADGNSLYNLACLAARLHERDRAIELLLASVKAGFANIELFHSDPDLDTLRGLPDFLDLVRAAEEKKDN